MSKKYSFQLVDVKFYNGAALGLTKGKISFTPDEVNEALRAFYLKKQQAKGLLKDVTGVTAEDVTCKELSPMPAVRISRKRPITLIHWFLQVIRCFQRTASKNSF